MNELLSTRQAAEFLNCSNSFLEKGRVTGSPTIPFLKLGKAVRYKREALVQYLATCERRSTSDPGHVKEEKAVAK